MMMADEGKKLRGILFIVKELLVGITAIAGYGIIDMFKACNEREKEKTKKIINYAAEQLKETANDTLALEVPIRIFREVHEKMPEDETGYRLLLERAKAIIEAEEYHYDRVAEKLLEEAVGLSEHSDEARNLLESIKK